MNKETQLAGTLQKLFEQKKETFQVNIPSDEGVNVKHFSAAELSSPTGFLPVWLTLAEEHHKKMFDNKGFDITYYVDEESLCGIQPSFSAHHSTAVLLHFIHYTVENIISQARVEQNLPPLRAIGQTDSLVIDLAQYYEKFAAEAANLNIRTKDASAPKSFT